MTLSIISCKNASTERAVRLNAKFDAVFSENAPVMDFNGVVLISQKGRIIYKNAFGMSDYGNKIANTIDSSFIIASITKQFTASAILMLVEEGKIALDDKISKFLPGFKFGNIITVSHLLNHTSGIKRDPDYNFLFDPIPSAIFKHDILARIVSPVDRFYFYNQFKEYRSNYLLKDYLRSDFERFYLMGYLISTGYTPRDFPLTIKDSIDAIIKEYETDKLLFYPGYSYLYSNTGYMFLGYIIEKVSGMSYSRFIMDKIFTPLNMNNSGYGYNRISNPRLSEAYRYGVTSYPKKLNMEGWIHSAGGLYSTANDLLKWSTALDDNEILNKKYIDMMFTPIFNKYGYGWIVDNIVVNKRSFRLYEHTGYLFSYLSYIGKIPGKDITVILLSNRRGGGTSFFEWPDFIYDILLKE